MVHKILDWVDVPSVIGTMLWISVTDLSEWLKLLSIVIATAYVCRKWYLMEKRKDGTNTK